MPKAKDAKTSTQVSLAALTYKQRPGPEQVALHVEIDMPGSWFAWDTSSAAERKEKYSERHTFRATHIPSDTHSERHSNIQVTLCDTIPSNTHDERHTMSDTHYEHHVPSWLLLCAGL